MARPTSIEYEDVQAACEAIIARGEPISFAKVYRELGNRGSHQRVTQFVRQFEAEQTEGVETEKVAAAPELPPELIESSNQVLAGIWQLALQRAEDSYQAANARLAEDRLYWEGHAEIAEHHAQAADRRADEVQHELDVMRATAEAREQTVLDLETRLGDATAKLAAREDQCAAQREEIARLTAKMEAMESRLAESQVNLEKTRQDSQKSRDEASVLRGRAEAAEALLAAFSPAKPAKKAPAKP